MNKIRDVFGTTFGCLLFLIYGLISLPAIFAGIENWWGVPGWIAIFIVVPLAYIPVLGSVLAYMGATKAWGWSPTLSAFLFFWPYVIPVALYLVPLLFGLVIASPIIAYSLIAKIPWKRLPEWIRWILSLVMIVVFPLLSSAIVTEVTEKLMELVGINDVDLLKIISFSFLGSLAYTATLFKLIYLFIPRKGSWFAGAYLSITTVLFLFIVTIWILIKYYPGSVPFTGETATSDIIQMLTTTSASWYFFYLFRNKKCLSSSTLLSDTDGKVILEISEK